MKNWNILGHEKIVCRLQQNLSSGRLFQTYLFVGAEHLGKRTVAKRFFEAILTGGNSKADLTGNTASEAGSGNPANIQIVDNSVIKIQHIRNLRRRLSLTKKGKLLCLIDSYEKITAPAVQALLKILEEPRSNICFVIIAKNSRRILKTILSRGLVLHFNRVRDEIIKSYLFNQNCDFKADDLVKIAGRPGLAVKMLKSENFNNKLFWESEAFVNVMKADLVARFKLAAKLSREADLNQLFSEWNVYFHDLLLKKLSGNASNIEYQPRELGRILKNIQAAKSLLERKVNKRLILENLFLNL